MAKYYFVYVDSSVAIGPEDGVKNSDEAIEKARLKLIEMLQRNEVDFAVETEED